MYVDWNQVLKVEAGAEIPFDQIHEHSNGSLPAVYSQLFQVGKLSLKEFTLIKKLWKSDQFEMRTSVQDLLHWFFDSDSKHHRNSVSFTLKKLEKYGIIHCVKPDFKSYKLSLSSLIFVKVKTYLSRFYSNVDWYFTLYMQDGNDMIIKIERVPVTGLRQPITVIRTPILMNIADTKKRKINFNASKYAGLSESEKKRLERLSVFGQSYVDNALKQMKRSSIVKLTDDEIECMDEFVPYYENLICSVTNSVQYQLLDNIRNKKLSRLWKPIWKTFMLCKEHEWDWKIYLDAQFESFKNWNKSNLKFPMPNMLYSERALNAYDNYIYHNETAYRNEGWETTVQAKNTGKFADEVRKKLETDISQIKVKVQFTYMKRGNSVFRDIDRSRSDIQSLYWSKSIQDMWSDLSVEFLSMVPNSRTDLNTMRGRFDSWDAKLDCYDALVSNKAKMDMVKQIWSELDIPRIYGLIEVNSRINSAKTK